MPADAGSEGPCVFCFPTAKRGGSRIIVVMRPSATQQEIDGVRRSSRRTASRRSCGRRGAHRHRRRRRRRADRPPRHAARRRAGHPRQQAVQAREHQSPDRSRAARRAVDVGSGAAGRHRRAVLGRVAEQLLDDGARRERDGATLLRGGAFKPRTSPYAFQGLGTRRPRAPRGGARRDRAAGRHRGDRPARRRAGRRARRHPADRRAQHAELRAAARRSASAASRCCSSAACRRTIEELLLAAEYILAAATPA